MAGGITAIACFVIGLVGPRTIARWLWPAPAAAPRAIVFDNGSVRDLPASAPAVPARPRALAAPPGQLRKCVQPGGGVVYSNLGCPPGAKEAALRTDGVSVLPSGLPQRPAPAPATPGTPAAPRPLQPGETLQQRAIERAVEQATGGLNGR